MSRLRQFLWEAQQRLGEGRRLKTRVIFSFVFKENSVLRAQEDQKSF